MQKGNSLFSMLLLLVVLWAVVSPGAPGEPPATVNIHGQLLSPSGAPLTGVRVYALQFYDDPTGGGALGAQLSGTVQVSERGLFNIAVVLPPEVVSSIGAWYALGIDSATTPDGAVDVGDWFANRVKVESVPFARQAQEAVHVDASAVGSGTVDDGELSALQGISGNVQSQLDAKAGASEVAVSQADQDELIDAKADQAAVDASQAAQNTVIAGKLTLSGHAYVIVTTTDDASQNGLNLLSAYATARALTPHGAALSASNRAMVLVPPGQYDLGMDTLLLDTEFVDLAGLSTVRDTQHVFGTANGADTGVVSQTADDVRIENLFMECVAGGGTLTYTSSDPAAYFPDSDRPLTVIRNCRFEANEDYAHPMRVGMEYSGAYIDCSGGRHAFGGKGTASGSFTNCTGGDYAFGSGTGAVASGTFTHCAGASYAFGFGGHANGTFTNCTAGQYSFGASGGTASGTFTNCSGTAGAFGGLGTSSGTFTNCMGSLYSFGGSGGTASGKYYGCRMTGITWGGTFSGKMEGCHWAVGITCTTGARLYNSVILGSVNLANTTAGIAQCSVKGTIQNTGSASFNDNNIEDTSVS